MAGFEKCLLLQNAKFCRAFIEKVKQYPILYKRTDQYNVARQTLWQLLAIKCKLSNGSAAEAIWNHLKFEYTSYLLRRRKFRHARVMQFLKPFLRCDKFSENDDLPICEKKYMTSSDDVNVLPPVVHKAKEKDVFVVVVKNDGKLLLKRKKPKPQQVKRPAKIKTSIMTLSSLHANNLKA